MMSVLNNNYIKVSVFTYPKVDVVLIIMISYRHFQ